jgi:CPW-WPC domain-containing protein
MMFSLFCLSPTADCQFSLSAGAPSPAPSLAGQLGNVAILDAAHQIANHLVKQRLDTHFFAGSCIRNHADICPKGWALSDSRASCYSEGTYEGPCAGEELQLSAQSTPEAKSEIAARCRVEWPCKACLLDFSACPFDWSTLASSNGKLICKSVGSYDGYCDRKVDFTGVSDREKAIWSTRCGVLWRCKT